MQTPSKVEYDYNSYLKLIQEFEFLKETISIQNDKINKNNLFLTLLYNIFETNFNFIDLDKITEKTEIYVDSNTISGKPKLILKNGK